MYREMNSWGEFGTENELLLLRNSIKKEDQPQPFFDDEIFSAIKYEYTIEASSENYYEVVFFRDNIHAHNQQQKQYANDFRLYMPRMYLITLDLYDINDITKNVYVFEKQEHENKIDLSHDYSRLTDSVWTEEENIPDEIYNYLTEEVAANALKEILEERK
jgi:hypothetical protein